MHVLIADDDREIRSALRLALSEVSAQVRDEASALAQGKGDSRERLVATSCTISEARDADEVRTHLQGPPIDAVLLDWELPASGDGLLAEIRSQRPGCTVIAMSGRPEAREDSLESGADYFIGKNDPPSLLLDLLRSLWGQRPPRERAR